MNSKKVVIIVGLGWQQKKYISYIRNYNYFLVGIDENESAIAKKHIDFFIKENIFNTEKILGILKKKKIKKPTKVISFLSDKCEVAADLLRKKFDIDSNIYQDIKLTVDKEYQLKKLKKKKIKIPKSYFVKKTTKIYNNFKNYPLIIKPVDSSGSRGVIKINNYSKLIKNLNNSIKFSKRKKVIIQKYIDGLEYSIECIFFEEKINILLIAKRFKKKSVSANLIMPIKIKSSFEKMISNYLTKVCKELKFKNCFVHAELILSHNSLYLIDIAARPGGFFIDKYLIPDFTNIDLPNLYISFILGIKIERLEYKRNFSHAALLYKYSKLRLEKIKKIKSNEVYFQSHKKTNDSDLYFSDASRTGIFFIKCKSRKKLLKQIKKINNL